MLFLLRKFYSKLIRKGSKELRVTNRSFLISVIFIMYIVKYFIFPFLLSCKIGNQYKLYLLMSGLAFAGLSCYADDNPDAVLKTVVIDPGHGGRDPGAVGAKSKEKDIVLDISLRLGKMINQKYPEVNVMYTRKTDVLIDLDKRGGIANKAKANLFISIHANANKNKNPYGTETFVMGYSKSSENMEVAKRENSVILIEDDYSTRYEGFDPNSSESYIYFSLLQNSYLNQSLDFASEIQDQFKSAKRLDRGVKQANFLVLWQTTMPSVLVEVGFISNPNEEKYMNSDDGKNELATSIFRAFCKYKTKFESRSSFTSHQIKSEPGPDSIPVVESKPEKEVKTTAPNKAAATVMFCVQIATSPKPMEPKPENFKKHKGVERIQTSPSFYKYITGRTSNYEEAQQTLKKMKADFKDAFIVGIKDDKIIPVGEALKLAQ